MNLRLARRASTAAALALLVGAGAAEAAPVNLSYKCKFPIAGIIPFTVQLDVAADAVDGGLQVSGPATVTGFTPNGSLEPLFWGGETIKPVVGEYASRVQTEVTNALGLSTSAPLLLSLEPYTASIGDLDFELEGTASTPVLDFPSSPAPRVTATGLLLNLRAVDRDGLQIEGFATPTRDIDGTTPYVDIDRQPGQTPAEDPTFNVPCKLDPATQDATLLSDEPDTPPAKPGTPTLSASTTSRLDIAWTGPGENAGVVAWNVYVNGQKAKTVTTLSALLTGLQPNTQYSIAVEAVYADGSVGPKSDEAKLSTRADTIQPTTPLNLKATRTSTTVTLTWSASADDVGVVGYDVFQGSALVQSVNGLTTTITGLRPDLSYTFGVTARDAAGNRSQQATVLVPGTPPPPPPIGRWNVAGTAGLKTLAKGNLALKGQLDLDFNIATGTAVGSLALNDTSGRLVASGFLPLTAKFGFVPTGSTTGTFDDGGVLKTSSKVRIKVKEVKLFGAIPLAGGNNCQTKSLTDLNLKSSGEFDLLSGGTLGGTFSISDLNGCGVLNGLVSPLTAGGGNTITLGLTSRFPS